MSKISTKNILNKIFKGNSEKKIKKPYQKKYLLKQLNLNKLLQK